MNVHYPEVRMLFAIMVNAKIYEVVSVVIVLKVIIIVIVHFRTANEYNK